MSKGRHSAEWINTQGEKMVMVTQAEYETLKADILKLRVEVNELQAMTTNRGATLDRLRDAVERLRREAAAGWPAREGG